MCYSNALSEYDRFEPGNPPDKKAFSRGLTKVFRDISRLIGERIESEGGERFNEVNLKMHGHIQTLKYFYDINVYSPEENEYILSCINDLERSTYDNRYVPRPKNTRYFI